MFACADVVMPPKIEDKYLELSEQLATVLDEIKSIKLSMITKDDLDRIVASVRNECADLLSAKDSEIRRLNDRLCVQKSAIDAIKLEQNKAEQYTRRQSLRINGVKREKGETASDCLNTVRKIIRDEGLDIPDNVIDRAHRVGVGKKGKHSGIICKFTTWRHRTMLYRARVNVTKTSGYKISLDITKKNIELMDALRAAIKSNNAETVDYVFCDVNCQPMIKLKSGNFLRFDTFYQGMTLLGLMDNGDDGDGDEFMNGCSLQVVTEMAS